MLVRQALVIERRKWHYDLPTTVMRCEIHFVIDWETFQSKEILKKNRIIQIRNIIYIAISIFTSVRPYSVRPAQP